MRSIAELVEPDRVHRSVYTDQEIFDREIEQIFEKIWVYCGHESQVKAPGDYCTVQIGRQPMIMVRGRDGAIHVLYNRCPHRGVELCGARSGNTGSSVRLLVSRLELPPRRHARGIPLPQGYEGTRMSPANPDCSMKRAARVDSYRGFRLREPRERGSDPHRIPGRCAHRLRRHVRPIARRRGRDRAGLPPRDAAFELEVLHGEPARRPASVGHAPIHRSRGRARSSGDRRTQGGDAAALLSLPLDLRLLVRPVGLGSDREFSVRPRHPEGLHGPAARRTRTR